MRLIIKLTEGQVCYRFHGDLNSSKYILYFHGMFGSRLENYFDFDKYGQKYGFKIISFDRFGYGLSTDVSSLTSYSKIASRVIEFLDALGIKDPINLIGYSNGGSWCLALLYYYPQRLNNVAILSCSSLETTVVQNTTLKMMELFSQYGKWVVKTLCWFASKTVSPKEWADYMMGEEASEISKNLMKAKMEIIKNNYAIGISQGHPVAVDFIVPNNTWDFSVKKIDISKISGKVHLFSGEKDKLEPIENVKALFEALKGSELKIFENVSHFLFTDDNIDFIFGKLNTTDNNIKTIDPNHLQMDKKDITDNDVENPMEKG